MRKGFDQFCPYCAYAAYLNPMQGKCYCRKIPSIVGRNRFPPTEAKAETPEICRYFRTKA